MKVRIKFEPRDFWLGVYWNPRAKVDPVPALPARSYQLVTRRVYVCLVPMLPIVFEWQLVQERAG